MEDLAGKQLGPYRIVASLGEGSMATVCKAYQPGVDRHVALKVLPRNLANNPVFVGRFQQEARVAANLRHPNILPLYDYGEAGGYLYMVMPLVETGTLAHYLRGDPLPLAQIRGVISQVGDALHYAHALGVIHRDVKPGNVLIDERGSCLLMDFGIAKLVAGTAQFTAAGLTVGTPTYMSPEQGAGQKVDGRSDIYSLGVILYQMATGRLPFQAKTPLALVMMHMNEPVPSPRSMNPALPLAVEQLIVKSLAKQPASRYATAGELVRALQGAIAVG